MAEKRILVVEDEAVIALLIETTLKNHGYEIVGVATNGEDAVRHALEYSPDLVLMDIKLQGEMLGTEAARLITAKKEVPIVFLSAHSDPNTRQKAMTSSPYGYLLKPFKGESLIVTIDTALETFRQNRETREREAKLNAFFNAASIGTVVVDGSLSIREINTAALDLADVAEDEALGSPFADLFPIENTRDPAGFRLGIASPVEASFVNRHGNEVWCSVETVPLELPNGEPEMMAVLLRDLSHEKKLAKTISLINRAIEIVNVGIVVTNAQGEIQFVNTTQAKMHGYRKMELIGRPASMLGASRLRVKKTVKEWSNYRRETINLRRDGSEFPVELATSVVRTKGGEVEAVVTACEDISVRKEQEEKLRQSECDHRALAAQLRSLLNGMQDSICLLSLDFELVWANENTRQLFGLDVTASCPDATDLARLLGCSDGEVCRTAPDVCAHCCAEKTRRSRLPAEAVSVEHGTFILRSTFPYYDDHGQMSGVIQVARDITLQEELRRESELNSRMTSLGVVAASMGHEINNPNGIVLANAEVLKKLMDGISPLIDEVNSGQEEVANIPIGEVPVIMREAIEHILQGGERIKKYVQTIRDFAVPSRPTQQGIVDLTEILDKTLVLLRPSLSRFTRNFETAIKTDCALVLGDEQKLEQVIVNLLLNAAQALAGRDKGVAVEIERDDESRSIVLTVRDEGCGMTPEQLEKIRLPFFSTREKEGGSGLGMAIVDRIIEEHKGAMTILSTPGVGTEIKIGLPWVENHKGIYK